MGTLHEGGTVGAMLISATTRFADRPAIADNQSRWTYRELGDAAGCFIALFRRSHRQCPRGRRHC